MTLQNPAQPVAIDALNLDAPATLHLGRSFAVNGDMHIDGNLFVDTDMTTVGSVSGVGTFSLGVNFLDGRLAGSGALEIPSTISIDMRHCDNARLGAAGQPFVNRGYIFGGASGSNFRPVIAGSAFSNLGVIEARSGAISFGGSFTRADLGNLVWASGGTFGIGFRGTLLNQNQTLIVDAAHPWELAGGTISGGTIQVAPGSALVIPGTYGGPYYNGVLDNVIVNGRITHQGSGNLDVTNGLLQGNAEIFLDHGSLDGPSRLITSSAALTVSSPVWIHGGGLAQFGQRGRASGVGNGLGAIINHGTIAAEFTTASSGTFTEFDLLGTLITTDGMLSIKSGCSMYVAKNSSTPTTLTFANGGMLGIELDNLYGPGLLNVNGQLDLSTTGDSVLLTGGDINTLYRIATASGGVIGQFDSVTPGYQVTYSGNNLYAQLVPEPATMTLLIMSCWVGGSSRWLRRRLQ